MEKGLNFRTLDGQNNYYKAYEESLRLWKIPLVEKLVETTFGSTHVIMTGNPQNKSLVLLHAASCGATIWYKNVEVLSLEYCVYAIDLITESSKSILKRKINDPKECAEWLDETVVKLGLNSFYLCGLSIGGWNAANYASRYPQKVDKLVLLSPIQTLAKMYPSFFIKIMKMGFHPTKENVEKYIGWGNSYEEPLPESIIEQFKISVMNMNSNAVFPKMLKPKNLEKITSPTLVLLGENEFAFNVIKASSTAISNMSKVQVEIIEHASHLISVSMPDITNKKIVEFLKFI